jgi:hypothetical protein
MRNIHMAEWILGLVTSRDRAASTVGDLLEEAAGRGTVWFWSCILRTAASLVWSGLTANPLRVIGAAFLGLAVDIVASVLFAALCGVVFFFVAYNGHQLNLGSVWWIVALHAPTLVISVWIGRMLARWAPGRELAVCLVYGIVGSVFNVAMNIVSPGGLGLSALLVVFLSDAAQRTPVLAGAVWGRRLRMA